MTGRQKIEAALSREGTHEFPVVICYEQVYIRDHWEQLTSCPWWFQYVPDLERQMLWHREVIEKTGQDWFDLPGFYSREERRNISIEDHPEGIVRLNNRTGKEEKLIKPEISGWSASTGSQSVHPEHIPETPEEIEAAILLPPDSSLDVLRSEGRADLADEMLKEFGGNLFPMYRLSSPLWCCYNLWGFEGMMGMIGSRTDLVEFACSRFLASAIAGIRKAAALGAEGIWVEEALTDMISPQSFELLDVRFLKQLMEEIHAMGMKSFYYFCGNPEGKWEQILSVGADALALEESKKGFSIDIEDVVTRVGKRCTVLGNLDAVGILQDGNDEQLKAEISRQLAAGGQNGGRFIMSVGSPVTPGTSVDRVQRYCDLVRELQHVKTE